MCMKHIILTLYPAINNLKVCYHDIHIIKMALMFTIQIYSSRGLFLTNVYHKLNSFFIQLLAGLATLIVVDACSLTDKG